MNDTGITRESEFIFRRLHEPLSMRTPEGNFEWWFPIIGVVGFLAVLYVVLMYRRDGTRTGTPWAIFLATLRLCVYGIIIGIFLLPARQLWENTEKKSRVLILLDVSPSVASPDVSDDRPENVSADGKRTPRLENVLDALTDEKVKLVAKLLEKNPVAVYRFGSRADDDAPVLTDAANTWSKDQWRDFARYNWKPWLLDGLSDQGRQLVEATPPFQLAEGVGSDEWAMNWQQAFSIDTGKISKGEMTASELLPAALNDADKAILMRKSETIADRVGIARQLADGTDVAGSMLTVLNREANNMLQGVIVFSDGRSTRGSEAAIRDVRARAESQRIPIFVVAVGEDRPKVEIRITDVQAPTLTPPDEAFKVYVEADGDGLQDAVVPVYLDITTPDQKEPVHTLTGEMKFTGEPPHGQAEFVINPKELPEILKNKETEFREFIEGEWQLRARIGKDKREMFAGKEHVSDPVTRLQVLKAPLRVLMIANGPNRDYQFLRTLISREKERAELSIWLQNEGGKKGEIVQDVDKNRLLSSFPTRLNVNPDPKETVEDKYYNLAQYDVVLAFDPDWNQISREQFQMLETWVDKGGGFVLVAGPVCTSQLARAEDLNRLQPLLDLLPIVPGDNVLASIRRSTKNPWRLTFPGANPETDFLKLDDELEGPRAGWDSFFDGKERTPGVPLPEGAPQRGFYSFYPVNNHKPGANVIARFTDPDARGQDREDQPFLVSNQVKQGRSIFLGSSEIWRLRSYKIAYFERFWLKLLRYAAVGSRKKQDKRGRILMARDFTSRSFIRMQAQLQGSDLKAVPESTKPKMSIRRLGTDPATNRDYLKRPYDLNAKQTGTEWAGMFQRQILATPTDFPAGDYELEVEIPDSSDFLRQNFRVRDSNPELENPRPDLVALASLAGDAEELATRFENAAQYEALRSELKKNHPTKLLFKPSDSRALELIPECMQTQTKPSRNRGPVEDLWDKGPTFMINDRPIMIGTWLFVIVGLLSVEWLTRKLLRLA